MVMRRKKPLLEAIERAYGYPIGDVVEMLYKRYGNFEDVASELGTTRQTLYNWVGTERMRRIRVQQMMAEVADEQVGVGSGANP